MSRNALLALGALLACGLALSGCVGGGPPAPGPASTGDLVISARWPEATAEVLPVASRSIVVGVTEQSSGAQIATRTLTRLSPTTTVQNVEANLTYDVVANAYPNEDGSGTPQATGTTSVLVQPNQVNNVPLTMGSTIVQVVPSHTSLVLEAGTPLLLTATAKDATGATVLVTSTWLWTCSDPDVLTVSVSGQVTTAGEGLAVMTVTETESGVSAQVNVLVIHSLILFTSDRDGNQNIYRMKGDGTAQTRLTTDGTTDRDACWSPDGTRIAFTSYRDGNQEVYVMNANGTGQTDITNDPGTDDYPDWAPDGSKIAFVSARAAGGDRDVYVMNPDGAGVTQLTDNNAQESSPAWSPDSTQIAFGSYRDGNWEVYVMDANGANQTRLTDNPAEDACPSWSPDGTKIVFHSTRDGDYQMYVMNADGTGQTRVSNSTARDMWAEWGPGGIMFTSDRDGQYDVYRMSPDGSNVMRLTNDPAADGQPGW